MGTEKAALLLLQTFQHELKTLEFVNKSMFNACLMSIRIAHIIKMTNYRKTFLQKPSFLQSQFS